MSQQILPFYLLCDESGSMAGAPVDAINQSLPELHQEIGSNPVVADKTRFCLMSFSDQTEILLPLSDLSQITSMPALKPNGGTLYGQAFDRLRNTINSDVNQLKNEGHQVYRPTVFFLSDGQPGDNWQSSYQMLIDQSWRPRPNILAFGFGQADATVIRQIATAKAFISDNSLSPADALKEFAKSLIRSIVNSGTSSGASDPGSAKLVMPENVPGYVTMEAEAI
jgi:uncharacterized protein YegL